jgi:uncharacterized membrane protein HdeD (DUF308 family)
MIGRRKDVLTMLRKLRWTAVLVAAACVICGLVLIFSPGTTAKAVVRVFGWLALISGVVHVITYFADGKNQRELTRGLVNIVAALILLMLTAKIIALLSIALGVFALVVSAFAIQSSLDARKLGHPYWWVLFVAALVGVILGLVMIFAPLATVSAIVVLAGFALLAYGIEQLWSILFAVKA